MTKFIRMMALFFYLSSCSNTPEFETGEIKTLQLLKDVIDQSSNQKIFIDARQLLTRDQIDTVKIPILFVQLETGQNGTLTLYPGQGVGQTWLGADGAIIILNQGIIKASRGMGDDIMGSSSSLTSWSSINENGITYDRRISYLSGNNKTYSKNLKCKIKKIGKKTNKKIWDAYFRVQKYEEFCNYNGSSIKNNYYLDEKDIVRKSMQYHSETLGYIIIERLDRSTP